MIDYVISQSIDGRILKRIADTLLSGGLVAVPTDTSFSIVCAINSKEGYRRLKKLQGNPDTPLTLICSDLAQIGSLCDIGTAEFRVIKRLVPGPYVFILPALNSAVKRYELKRAEFGVRIPDSPIATALVTTLGLPVLSVTAKRTMTKAGFEDPEFEEELLFENARELEEIPGLDRILDSGEDRERKLSTVLAFRVSGIEVLRRGAGKYP